MDPTLPPVQADAAALTMILRNLVENSVRHARIEPVRVRLTAAARGESCCSNTATTARAWRPVRASLGRLFGRGPHSSGAGVGLYLVRRLMQRMGGHARFDTAPGQGFQRRTVAAGQPLRPLQ